MKASIEVENRKEGDNIKTALQVPEVRAFVVVCGALLPLTDRQRQRVMAFVKDQVDEGFDDGKDTPG